MDNGAVYKYTAYYSEWTAKRLASRDYAEVANLLLESLPPEDAAAFYQLLVETPTATPEFVEKLQKP
jgi:hypothetical protein